MSLLNCIADPQKSVVQFPYLIYTVHKLQEQEEKVFKWIRMNNSII